MTNWLEAIQRDDVLVVWHLPEFSRDEQREICQLLSALPVRRLILFGNAEDLLPVFLEAGKVPVIGMPAATNPVSSNEIMLLEITESSLLHDQILKETMQRWMCVSPKILLGVDSTASWLRQLYQSAALALGKHLPPGVLITRLPPAEGFRKFYQRNFTQVLENDPIEWLRKEVDGYRQNREIHPDLRLGETVDQEPYLFLDSYAQADAALFYGRRQEIRTLAEMAISSQLTVLYGPSGVGKTSLIGAGLLPLLAKNEIVGIQARIATDPSWGLSGAQANQVLPALDTDFVEQLAALADSTGKLLVVVFDQVEELFTLANPVISASFAASIKEALTKIPAPIHFIFSIREDYLAHLAELRSHLPRMLDRSFRLEPLNARQAYEVIVAPAEKCGYRFEPELADTLIGDLFEGKQSVDPVDLQIVCYRLLFITKQRQAQTFLLQDYQSLGRAETILADFLEGVIAQGDCPAGTVEVLKALTTSVGTKVLLSKELLAQDTGMAVEYVEKVLHWLERPYRLVRLIQTPQGEAGVELRHDVLAKRILGWITDPDEQSAKRVKDLLRMELQSHIRMGLLPSRAKFQQVDSERENPFLTLRIDELILLIKAAFRFSDQLDAWLVWLPDDEKETVLLQALSDPEETVRRRAVALLPQERSLDFLTTTYEKLEEGDRIQYLRTLSWLGEKLAWQALENYRLDASRSVRAVVWALLYELNGARATALKNAEQRRFLLAGGMITWLMVFGGAFIKNGSLSVSGPGWLVLILSSLLLTGICLLAGKISHMVSRILTVGLIATVCYLAVGGWGLPLALVVSLGIGANLSNGAAALLGFIPLMLPVWSGSEQVIWILPFVLTVYALIAMVWFSRHLLRRDRKVSWILVCSGFIWAISSIFISPGEFQVVALVYLCGVAFGQVFERASIFEDPHGPRFSYVLNLSQKTWSLLHQMPANFRSGLGWLAGTAWAGVLLTMAGVQMSRADNLNLLWVGCAFIIATWFPNGSWYWLFSLILIGSATGFVVGGWAWALGIFSLSLFYIVMARIFPSTT